MTRYIISTATLLSALVYAGPLDDYLFANKHRNRMDLVKELNAEPIIATNSITNMVAKTAQLQVVEGEIIAELVAMGISPTSVVTGGWEFAISKLVQSFDASGGDANLERAALRRSAVLQARQAQWKAVDPYGIVTPDFGGPNHIRVSTEPVKGPSLAKQILGRKATYGDVR